MPQTGNSNTLGLYHAVRNFGYVPEPEAIGMMICALSFALMGEGWIPKKQRRGGTTISEGEGLTSDASEPWRVGSVYRWRRLRLLAGVTVSPSLYRRLVAKTEEKQFRASEYCKSSKLSFRPFRTVCLSDCRLQYTRSTFTCIGASRNLKSSAPQVPLREGFRRRCATH